MRSRIVTGSVLLVLILAMVSTCRRESSTPTGVSQSTTDSTPPATTSTTNAIAPEPPANRTSQPTADRAVTDDAPAAPTAMITANDPDAQVNVRSQPAQTGDAVGYGRVGERVMLGQTADDAEGYTWYYVTFPNDTTTGWVRGDLLEMQPTAPTSPTTAAPVTNATSPPPNDVLKRSLDETCGGTEAIESYFVTPSNTIYVCKNRNRRTYLSQEAGTEQVVTAEDVEASGGGYIISNGSFEYRLDSSSLVIVRFADSGQPEEVLRENVIYSERY